MITASRAVPTDVVIAAGYEIADRRAREHDRRTGAYIGSMPEPTWTRRVPTRRWPLFVGLGIALSTACTGDDDTATTDSAPVVTATTQAPKVVDGILRIGLLVPQTGDGATIGQSLSEAAQLAVDRANASGGFVGARRSS